MTSSLRPTAIAMPIVTTEFIALGIGARAEFADIMTAEFAALDIIATFILTASRFRRRIMIVMDGMILMTIVGMFIIRGRKIWIGIITAMLATAILMAIGIMGINVLDRIAMITMLISIP